jgi:nitrate/TMAO reductase-like tetraheme cytochrome c subunit
MKKRRLGFKIIILAVLILLAISLPQIIEKPAPVIEETQSYSDDLCMSCHGKQDCEADVYPGSLEQSAHKSLMCTDCHLYVHKETPNLKLEMNNQCIDCHASDCQVNVHSNSLTGGIGALCTDCHGIHNILPVDDPNSSVYKLNVHETCTKCHQDIIEPYHYSFHGTAVDLGSLKAATCIDCHGTHNILPPSDPNSSIAKENVADTCAKCHRTPQPNFAEGMEHLTPYDKEKEGAFWLWVVWKFFIALILFDILKDCTIAIFELVRKLRNRKEAKKDNQNHWDI